ncbi:uncharacterized protein LOC115077325 [Rhinatrema bivittatum]|uniref:uncharacterized protein LOC115077325 n=1 Tax=Rhinatrema bivittatum TaxID=194408 RepID=UPI00112D04B4|nr:uncharacterized protein LOC115077325 [Rhinatrema bivittatum]
MENTNQTRVTDFVFLGLVDTPLLNALLFLIFAVFYLMSLAGNAIIFVIIRLNSCLHSPMYFFLSFLALVEIWFTTTTLPQMLVNFLQESKKISFAGCLTQMYFFISLGGTECVLLAMMAYDRYVAICSPLHYSVIMNSWMCLRLSAISGFVGFVNGLVHTILTSRLSFCKTNIINHFVCDIPPLLKLSCSNSHTNEIVASILGGSMILGSFLLTLISYGCIITTILKIRTAEGRRKSFSTCTSHLTVVSIFFVTVIYFYLHPTPKYNLSKDRVVFIIYSTVTPVINPIIYSFRNREVQGAIRKLLKNRFLIYYIQKMGEKTLDSRRLMANPKARALQLEAFRKKIIQGNVAIRQMKYMENTNQTRVTEFLFLGLVNTPSLNELLFLIFAIIYLMTLAENLTIIVIIRLDSHLHSPMYFFLSNLAMLEIWYATTITPKILANFLQESKTISFTGCLTQMYFFTSLGGTECVLLTVMAYDRYVAICSPLSYLVIMKNRVCLWLVAVSGFIGFMNGLVQTVLIARLSFCKTNKINHFICDIPPLLTLSCSDTHTNEIAESIGGGFLILGSFLMILISYIYIISTILKISTTEGRRKAFSTCSSHLTVVTIYFGTLTYTYMRPTSSYGLYEDRMVFIIYSTVSPLLNPFIYSFRNKEVHGAFRKILKNRVRF